LFAPVAAMLEQGKMPQSVNISSDKNTKTVALDLAEVIYIDHYGNVMTGVRAKHVAPDRFIVLNENTFAYAATFSQVKPGEGFWHANSSGLLEIAVNQGRADRQYHATIGQAVKIVEHR
jgi:S-adenosylmethionine hydrolase